jgi:Mg2+ and Co2+ transporter CorA
MFPKSLQDTISHLLHTQSRLRDDDRRLTATVWAQVEMPHAESIRRTRQKLQEKHPNLRGQRYEERQQKLEPEVREVMRAWK